MAVLQYILSVLLYALGVYGQWLKGDLYMRLALSLIIIAAALWLLCHPSRSKPYIDA